MKPIFALILLLLILLPIKAQEVANAITDKECYLTGERLHVRIDITGKDHRPATLSKVAYVEIADAHRICAQAMVQLTEGCGWADIALPATMHSGNYQLSVYTRNMRLAGQDHFFRKLISVVNLLRVVRADDIVYLPADSFPQPAAAPVAAQVAAGSTYTVSMTPEWQGCTLSLTRKDLQTPSDTTLPALRPSQPEGILIPEAEGHIVIGRPTSAQTVAQTRLVMVGRTAAVFDGQWQPDGTWMYYTSGLNGTLPTILNSYDTDGKPVGMEFVSPFARVLPEQLPSLQVYCDEEELQRRSLSAQREQALTNWHNIDSLSFSHDYMSASPHYHYDLDEWTKFSTVREILIEFVKGVKRSKQNGVNMLFTIDPYTHDYSRWPALVLLDGMPVYDVDEILEYDARLLKYVQIFTDRYTFGNTICQGIISFISQRGRLSNYKIDAGSHLVSYQFPQDRPDFIYPASSTSGTLYWNPYVTSSTITLTLPAEAGTYELVRQRLLPDGKVEKQTEQIVLF